MSIIISRESDKHKISWCRQNIDVATNPRENTLLTLIQCLSCTSMIALVRTEWTYEVWHLPHHDELVRTLHNIYFGISINHEVGVISSSVTALDIPSNPITSLTHRTFGHYFNQPFEIGSLPSSLQQHGQSSFQSNIAIGVIPSSTIRPISQSYRRQWFSWLARLSDRLARLRWPALCSGLGLGLGLKIIKLLHWMNKILFVLISDIMCVYVSLWSNKFTYLCPWPVIYSYRSTGK